MQHKIKASTEELYIRAQKLVLDSGFAISVRNDSEFFFTTSFLPLHIIAQLQALGVEVVANYMFD
jgi:hypothetical protein